MRRALGCFFFPPGSKGYIYFYLYVRLLYRYMILDGTDGIYDLCHLFNLPTIVP